MNRRMLRAQMRKRVWSRVEDMKEGKGSAKLR